MKVVGMGIGAGRGSRSIISDEWHRLKPALTHGGYLQVRLHTPSGRINVRVHRLVMLAFVGPCPDGYEVCHSDGIRTNNKPGNLRYGTGKDNAADRNMHGNTHRGEKVKVSKLNPTKVLAIRSAFAAGGTTHQELAEVYGVSDRMISLIVNRRNWKHVA